MIAVTGITGHTGSFFLGQLIEHKYSERVRCLVRETSDTAALDASGLDIEKVVGDITDANALHALLHGANAVLHIVNIHFSQLVIKAAVEEGVKRAVLVHTTGIYSKHKMASEEYKKIEAEISGFLRDSHLDVTILRPTMIFGDMRDHNIHKFIQMVDRLPVMPEIEHGTGRLQPVNARDLGKACFQAISAAGLPEYDYIISGERPVSMHELFHMIGDCLGKKTRTLSCPMWLGTLMARCLKAVSFGRTDYVEKVLRMGEDRDFPHEAAFRDFGYRPEPFEIGLRREVEQYLLLKKR